MTSEEQSHGIGRLRHGLWPLAFRSRLRKGKRITRPPTPPPTCEERVHYPIFNPRDPRHNPSAVSFSGFNLSEDSSHLQSTEYKTHSFPRRSLRRARSGLLAIRAGIHRRPREQNQRHSIPGLWMPSGLDRSSSDHQAECFPSTISEASTENERGFGVNLYRTRCNGLPTRRLAYAEPDEYENAFTHGSTSGIPEVDIGPAGLRLDGDTLHELSEPEENEESLGSEATRQPSKGMAITWDDGHLNRFPSSHATSDYIGSGTTSTSSEESTDSQVISDANQALEALCLLVPPTGNSCSDSDVEPDIRINCAVQEDIPSPDSPTLPSGVPVERHLDESNAGHSTTGDNDQLEQAKPTGITEQVSQVEEDKEAEEVKEAEEIRQAEQTHQASEVEESEGELEEVPAESVNDTTAMPDPTVLNDISANSLKALENIAGSSSGQYTQSRYSASLSEGNSSTPPTSLCIDSPNPLYYDDLISLPSLNMGDQYFYADGKTTTYNPGQDRTPIKSENVLIRNGSIDSGFSSGFSSGFNIERSISVSTRGHAPQLLGPGSVVQPPTCQPRLHNNRLRRSRGTSDSEDCYFTYSMFQRHYGS